MGVQERETRLLSRLCIELAKERRNTWVGLYTSPMGAFLSERTIGAELGRYPYYHNWEVGIKPIL